MERVIKYHLPFFELELRLVFPQLRSVELVFVRRSDPLVLTRSLAGALRVVFNFYRVVLTRSFMKSSKNYYLLICPSQLLSISPKILRIDS